MINVSRPYIGIKEKKAVLEVLTSGNLAQGEKVEEFEINFAKYIGTKFAIATSNGTTALFLALSALGIGKGDEVITTSFSFIASANAILFTGAKPVFVDIESDSFNLNPSLIEKKISKKTKAILPVHLYGLPANMKEIKKIAKKHNLFVIEDACQAHGATIDGKKAGSIGIAGCFSFYATKNMTTGEGGMITTNNPGIAKKVKLLRQHGMEKRYHHKILGYNFRMMDITAALGIEQLKLLDERNKIRQSNAAFLTKELSKIGNIQTPKFDKTLTHVFNQYTIRVKKDFPLSRNGLIRFFASNGIGTGIYYPIPIHKQQVYKNLGYRIRLPVTEKLSKEVVSLPIHPQVTKANLRRIVQIFLKANKKSD